MMKRPLYIAITALIMSCGNPPPEEPTREPTKETQQVSSAKEDATVQLFGMDFHYHAPNAPEGETQKPLFYLFAKSARPGKDGDYNMEGVEATVFAKNEKDSDIKFNAPRGTYNDAKGAFLEGPITVNIAESVLQLVDLNYYRPPEGQKEMITSDNKVILNNPNLTLTGTSMKLDPTTLNCTITNAHAIIPLGRPKP